jgi:hypothetical protein
VTIAAWAFILVGAGGILKDVLPLAGPDRAAALLGLLGEGVPMLAFIWLVRALAVVGGVGVLNCQPWSRWLLVAWMIFHVGLSLFHSIGEALAHVAIFAVLTFCLFRARSSAWFGTSSKPGSRPVSPSP